MTTRIVRWFMTAWLAFAAEALADGGAVQLSQVSGSYRVTLLTSPTPVSVGPIDVSVVVSDAESGEDIRDAKIAVSFAPADESDAPLTRSATSDASPTGLFQMATVDAYRPGTWTLVADIDGPAGRARVTTDLQVAPAIPRWSTFLGWIVLPLAPIVLYLVRASRGRSLPDSTGRS